MIRAFGSVLAVPFRRPAVITFAVWAYGLFWLLDGERYTLFLLPSLFSLLLGSGLIMVLFFCLALTQETTKPSPRLLFASAILLLPLLFLYPVQNETLGIYAFTKKTFSQPGMIPKPKVQAEPFDHQTKETHTLKTNPSLWELTQNWKLYEGRSVVTQGQLVKGDNIPSPYGFLFGFVLSCCAADAEPVGVLIESADLKDFKARAQWVSVSGNFETLTIDGQGHFSLTKARIQAIAPPPPNQRYIYADSEFRTD